MEESAYLRAVFSFKSKLQFIELMSYFTHDIFYFSFFDTKSHNIYIFDKVSLFKKKLKHSFFWRKKFRYIWNLKGHSQDLSSKFSSIFFFILRINIVSTANHVIYGSKTEANLPFSLFCRKWLENYLNTSWLLLPKPIWGIIFWEDNSNIDK